MRERINRLAKGIIDSAAVQLQIFPERLEAGVRAGEQLQGELLVNSADKINIKGLVYSSHERVKVINHAFGGLRNRIQYQIDTQYLEDGDVIEGSFYLVTNGGEREIPYSLRVQAGTDGGALSSLKTPGDFALVARKNPEQALRMFEYPDFTEAPYLQDPEARTIYEGLKGRKNRRNLLEEFLVALRVKDSVSLRTDTSIRTFTKTDIETEHEIDLVSSGWGYVWVRLTAAEPFIELERSELTDQDFTENRARIIYRIRPEYLHGGRNFGQIRICSTRQELIIPIEVCCGTGTDKTEGGAAFARYMELRLDWEFGQGGRQGRPSALLKEAEKLRSQMPENSWARLLRAECLFLSGYHDNARLALEEEIEKQSMWERSDPQRRCYSRYLYLLMEPSASGKETLIREIKGLLAERSRPAPLLLLLLLKIDETLLQNPLELYRTMESQFQNGAHSPFLYGAACRLIEDHPELFVRMGEFELQVLHLGMKRGLVSRETAVRAAGFLMEIKYYRRLAVRLALRIYQAYPLSETLAAVCSILIRGERKDREAFSWYEKALDSHINLTRLYEYFLYSLPEDYGHLLPKEVLLYFSYDKSLNSRNRCTLYRNIILYMNPSSELYQVYNRDMEQFAMDQLFKGRINRQLAVIYESMIYRDMIDPRVAGVLPEILNSVRICCEDPSMKYVILRSQELEEEETYLLENGEAYVPLISRNIVLFFQDSDGNRYLDVKHWKMAVMDHRELLDRCYEMCPDHRGLRLRACGRILEKGVMDGNEAGLLEEMMARLRLSPLYKKKIISSITEYYCRLAESESDEESSLGCACLIQMDKAVLGEELRHNVCQVLISKDYLREAMDMIREYGSGRLRADLLQKLCIRMILQQLFDQDELLLTLSYKVFQAGKAESVILDYLCEHFNGTVSQMYEVLIQGLENHVETYDLEERLLAQMLFTGCCDQMDAVFERYRAGRRTSETVIRAYFTQKCVQYFMEEKEVDAKVFSYLRQLLGNYAEQEKCPTIYLLAMTKYYAEQETLNEDDKALCRRITGRLLEKDMIFAYTRKLARHVPIPEDVMDRSVIEYRGAKDRTPTLKLQIIPEDDKFHEEEMTRVYQGIYVREMVLFEGETLEYEIYDDLGSGITLAAKGQIVCDAVSENRENSRFCCLNRMSAALNMQDEDKLQEAMEDYLKKSAVLVKLFPIT